VSVKNQIASKADKKTVYNKRTNAEGVN